MLHMNRTLRYQSIYSDMQSIYALRGLSCAHYFAGLLIGMQISQGLSEVERCNLNRLIEAGRYVK
jgi:hypothetical protein